MRTLNIVPVIVSSTEVSILCLKATLIRFVLEPGHQLELNTYHGRLFPFRISAKYSVMDRVESILDATRIIPQRFVSTFAGKDLVFFTDACYKVEDWLFVRMDESFVGDLTFPLRTINFGEMIILGKQGLLEKIAELDLTQQVFKTPSRMGYAENAAQSLELHNLRCFKRGLELFKL